MSQTFDPRQYMLSRNFEIFHYRDTNLDNVNLHHHDFYEIYFFMNGDVEYFIENRTYRLLPSDMLLISPLELHQPRINQNIPYERIVVWFGKSFLQRFSTPRTNLAACFDSASPYHTNLLRFDPAMRENIFRLLLRLCDTVENPDYGEDLMATSLVIALLVEINRAARTARPDKGEDVPSKDSDPSSSLISGVLDYINKHYNEDLTLDSISSRFFTSKWHLSHEFNRLVGTGVHRYITQKRLAVARQMLSDGVSPTDACRYCGFNDYANFYRAFKKIYAISPKEYLTFSRENEIRRKA